MVQLGKFIPLFKEIMGSLSGFVIEAKRSFSNSKGKSVPKSLLDTASNFINNKTNINNLDLFKPFKNPLLGSGLILTKMR